MNGLSKLGLPKFSDHMDPEDARALRRDVYKRQTIASGQNTAFR